MKISPVHLDRGQAHVGESRLSRVGGRTGTAAAGVDAGIDGGHEAVTERCGGGWAASPSAPSRRRTAWGSVTAPGSGAGWHSAQQNLGDIPVPTSTELHHTQANIGQVASQEIRTLRSSECAGVRFQNHLLISRLKVRFLHGSPSKSGGSGTPGSPDSVFATILLPLGSSSRSTAAWLPIGSHRP